MILILEEIKLKKNEDVYGNVEVYDEKQKS